MADSQLHQFVTRLMRDQSTRVESMLGEVARIEQQGAAQTRHLLEEWMKIASASVTYGVELSDQWRKLSLEATRRTFDLMSPKG